MRPFLMSTAALVLLTLPAMAQPGGDRDRGHGDRSPQQSQAAPQAAQERPHGPTNRGHEPGAAPTPQAAASTVDRGQGRADRGAAPQAAPVIQPQIQNRGDRGRSDQRGQNGGNGNRPQGQNFGNRQGGQNFGGGGPRRDFSGFRDFHRSFNAQQRFRAPAYRRPSGWYDHRWSFGEILPSLFWAPNYWLNDYSSYALPPPPYGTVWVREGYDALLVDRDTGEIITVQYGVFY